MNQISTSAPAIGDCKREGREAFRKHGVTGQTKHDYPDGSMQKVAFLEGFSDEKFAAGNRALNEARVYHALTVRDAPIDRAWAEKLSSGSFR
ncbi:hypothetical protein [Paraburkholderia fungorum]|uniref:Uncharacterized protein n=1 Tax=Paraburkholderia fungorum TaxID=134537 RepID=A0AAW3V1D5_9BURK|nr:hypothetical protein [Paraburkholderia fungorum]MBB4517220.1 hypothetical protein [Paraburkholderia fungorum]MBB6204288.1 hypothetical protein [Paraburkholderia fungorum]